MVVGEHPLAASGRWGWGVVSMMLHGGAVAGLLLSAAPVKPPGQEHVFQVVEVPLAPVPAAAAPPAPEPLPPEELPAEPEPEPPPPVEEAVAVEPPKPKPPPKPRPQPRPRPVEAPKPDAPPAPPVSAAAVASVPAPAALGAPAEDYVPPDLAAAYLHNPPPGYPLAARRRGLAGVVVLVVDLAADGRPMRVDVKKGSGAPVLDQAAREAVATWRFAPAKRGGRAVAASVEVPIRFSLNDRRG